MLDFRKWLESWQKAVLAEFGRQRVRFMGIQGSRARGEATEDSDIDVVLLLDELHPDDLARYRKCTASLPARDKLCGFISGMRELEHWQRGELFQFCLDTVPLLGSLDSVSALVTESDIRDAALTAVCGVYHAAVHNALHERSADVMREIHKSAFFALRAIHRLEAGETLRTRHELADARPEDRDLLYGTSAGSIDEQSARLITWASEQLLKHDA